MAEVSVIAFRCIIACHHNRPRRLRSVVGRHSPTQQIVAVNDGSPERLPPASRRSPCLFGADESRRHPPQSRSPRPHRRRNARQAGAHCLFIDDDACGHARKAGRRNGAPPSSIQIQLPRPCVSPGALAGRDLNARTPNAQISNHQNTASILPPWRSMLARQWYRLPCQFCRAAPHGSSRAMRRLTETRLRAPAARKSLFLLLAREHGHFRAPRLHWSVIRSVRYIRSRAESLGLNATCHRLIRER